MYKPVSLFIGLRYIHRFILYQRNNFVSWLSIIGITLGVMTLVIFLSVMNGFEHEIQNNILKFIPHVIISTQSGSLDPQKFPKSLIQLKGVNYITPLTTSNVLLQSNHSMTIGVLIGINPKQKDPLTSYLIHVKQKDLKPEKYNAILGEKLAKKLNVNCGDKLRIIVFSINQFTPIGYFPSQRLFNIIGTFSTNNEIDNYQVLVNIQNASQLMHYPKGNITGWRLWLKKPLEINKLNQQIFQNDIKCQDWRECKGELFQAIQMEKNIMTLLLSLIIGVAVFNMFASLGIMVMKKNSEIAILQTQGLTHYQIVTIFIIYGTISGIIGSLLGAILGIFLVSHINILIPIIGVSINSGMLPFKIKILQISSIILKTIILSFFSTLYPSWKAANCQPIEALRYE